MRKINKIINIALILMLIGVFWGRDVAFSTPGRNFVLRPPLEFGREAKPSHSLKVKAVKSWVFEAHDDWIQWVRFSENGKFMVTSSDDGTIKIWKLPDFNRVAVLKAHESLDELDDEELKPGEIRINIGYSPAIAISPDSRLIAIEGKDYRIILFDLETGKIVHTLGFHQGGVNNLCFSPDGKILASSDWGDKIKIQPNIYLWDVSSGELMHKIENPHPPSALDKTEDILISKRRLSSETRFELAWNVLTSKKYSASILSIAFSPDSRVLASVGENKTLCFWDVQTGGKLDTQISGFEWSPGKIQFSPKGDSISVLDKEFITLNYPALDSIETMEYTTERSNFVYHPSGRIIVVSCHYGGNVELYDLLRKELIAILKTNIKNIWTVAINPDGTMLAAVGQSKNAYIWELSYEGLEEPGQIGTAANAIANSLQRPVRTSP